MARKPNYKFERMERERKKAAKKVEKANAKAEKAARTDPQSNEESPNSDAGQNPDPEQRPKLKLWPE